MEELHQSVRVWCPQWLLSSYCPGRTSQPEIVDYAAARRMQRKVMRDIAGPLLLSLGLSPTANRSGLDRAERLARNTGWRYRYHVMAFQNLRAIFDSVESLKKAKHPYSCALGTSGLLVQIREAHICASKTL